MKLRTKTCITPLVVIGLMLAFAGNAFADGNETFTGYRSDQSKWSTGNLGKEWEEGDFVPYQLVITRESKVWGNSFDIIWKFHQDAAEAVYVDGFKNFQVGTTLLSDAEPVPPGGWGTPLVVGVDIVNYQDPWGIDPAAEDPTDPADQRYFTVVAGGNFNWPAEGSGIDQIVLYYQAHLTLTIIWNNGLESFLPPELDGDQFEEWPAEAKFWGSSDATGSSRQFALEFPGIGAKTVPIPIAQYPNARITGHKYIGCPDGDYTALDGWEISLYGEIALDGYPPIPYEPDPVLTGAGDWETGYYEFTGLVTGNYQVCEEERSTYTPCAIVVDGVTPTMITDLCASLPFEKEDEATVDFYNVQVGCLELTKEVVQSVQNPDDLDGSFTINVSGPGGFDEDYVFTMTDGVITSTNPIIIENLLPGTYTIDELDPDSIWDVTGEGTVEVNPGAESCDAVTVTNTIVPGCLELTKSAVQSVQNPDDLDGSFTINVTGPGGFDEDYVFTMTDGEITSTNPIIIENLLPGTYTVDEVDPSTEWIVTGEGDVQVASGETCATATVTNTIVPGCLELTKSVVQSVQNPDALDGSFTINVTGPGGFDEDYIFTMTNGAITSTNPITINNLVPGIYTVDEVDPSTEWIVTGEGDVQVASGETCATATVTNTYVPGCLEVTKVVELGNVVNPSAINATFTVTVTGPSYPGGYDVNFTVTDGFLQAPATVTISNLIPGAYTITEADAGDEWSETALVGPITVNPGGTCATATVTNTYVPGCLEVQKIASAPAYVPDTTFTITVTGPSYPGGTSLLFDFTGGAVTATPACLCDLIPGNYTVSEIAPAGWENPVLNPADGTVTVSAGDACGDGAKLVTVTNSPVPPACETACAAQGAPLTNELPGSNWFTYITYTIGDGNTGNPAEYPIYAGQTNLCGTLYVWNNGGNKLHVKYEMLGGQWLGFTQYHLQVDCSYEALIAAIVNQDGDGNPVPGQCEYNGTVDLLDTMEIQADISSCGDTIYIFAHSVICYYPM